MNKQDVPDVVRDKIEELRRCIFAGIESWCQAGKIVVDLLDAQTATIDEICGAIPGLSRDIVCRFEAIGRKQVYPPLLVSGSVGARHLCGMSYSEQEKYHTAPVELIVSSDDGYDVLKVRVDDLTSPQCRQVFAQKIVRDAGAQRAYLESQKREAVLHGKDIEEIPYSVVGGKIKFKQDCVLTKRELKQILQMMK